MVPLFIKEMRKSSQTDVHELVENCWNHGCVLNLKVHRGFATQAKDFLQQKASAPLEDWVYGAEDQTAVALAVMLR
jgi:hypothetical protein